MNTWRLELDMRGRRTVVFLRCVLLAVLFAVGCADTEMSPASMEDGAGKDSSALVAETSIAEPETRIREGTAIDAGERVRPLDVPPPLEPDAEHAGHQPSLDELLLFFPTKHPQGNWDPQDLVFEDVWITTKDRTRIHGWYCPAENPRAVLLFAHGNAGNLSDRSALMTYFQKQLRVTSLIFDYRGYGRSEGRPTVAGAITDGVAAAKFLAQRAGIDESELVLMGRSLGGAVVVQIARDIQPRGLIIESTFPSLKQIAKHHYSKLAWLVPKSKLDSKSAIADYKGSLLQSHGTVDQVIPLELGVELFDAANEPKRFIEIQNADHNDPSPQSYYLAVEKFLEDLSEQRK